MRYKYNYPRPAVTVDLLMINGSENPEILLIKRKNDPFKNCWALPGGFVDEHEDLPDAARRELKEETGLEVSELRQLHTFGKPGRDPRGHTISVIYYCLLDKKPVIQAGSDAKEAAWFSLHNCNEKLAFDHREIINFALENLTMTRTK